MATIVILESLDKSGRVQERCFVDHLPFNIGRGYGNDLILDDAFVSPTHARIDLDTEGNLVIIDKKSKNGVFQFQNKQKSPAARIDSGTIIRLGHTRIRFRKPDFKVPQAFTDTLNDHVLSRIMHKTWVLWSLWLFIFGTIAASQAMSNFNNHSIVMLLNNQIYEFALLIVWIGGWIAINRLTTHATNFGAHLLVVFSGYACLILLSGLNEYMSYMFSIADFSSILHYIIVLLVLSGVFYGHLRYCSLETPHRVATYASAVAVVIVGMQWFNDADKDTVSRHAELSVNLKPPLFNLVDGDRLEDFFLASSVIKNQIDQEMQNSKATIAAGPSRIP